MAYKPVTLRVLPGAPDVPTSIEISGEGWNPDLTVQLLIDDSIAAGNVPVDIAGDMAINYLLAGGEKNRVSDLNSGQSSIDNDLGAGDTILRIGDGAHSIEIRYAP